MARAWRRRNYLTKKGFQARFALPFLLAVAVANIVPVTLFVIFARNKIDGYLFSMRMPDASAGTLLSSTAFAASIVAVAAVGLLFLLASRGMYQKLAESLLQIRSDLNKTISGDLSSRITPRPSDEFKDFAEQANAMVNALQSRFSNLRNSTEDLAKTARALNTEPNAADHALTQNMRQAIKSVEEQIRSFKI